MKLRSVIVLALLTAGAAHAQLKPPAGTGAAPGSPSAPAAATMPDPVVEAKQEAAAKIADAWLKLIDNADYGRAWDECSALFRQKVTRQQWVDGLPKNRAEYGKFKARKLDGAAYRNSLPGAPDGEYVTVHFISDYEKNPVADELVTLVYQDGAWRPTGYLLK